MISVDQFQFLNQNLWAVIAQSQTFENAVALAGDSSAAEFVSWMDCLIDHHDSA
jgi:hypothetical protein